MARIREEVEGAGQVDAGEVQAVVVRVLGRRTPQGQRSELLARLKNVVDAEVRLGGDDANLVIAGPWSSAST